MRIVYSIAALRDVRAIAAMLEREGYSLPGDFASDLRGIETFTGQPDIGRETRRKATRVLLMRRFHCHVACRRHSQDSIRIIRVRDARRRPLSWT